MKNSILEAISVFLSFSLCFSFNNKLQAQDFTEQTDIILPGVHFSWTDWGDYDNDGDLDILLAGQDYNEQAITKICKNNGDNSFTEQTGISLTGVYGSAVNWFDYDNDGDLDILLSGQSSTDIITIIYRNNGNNTFTEQTDLSLPGILWGPAAYGDYDNDGDPDIVVTGTTGSNHITKIYRNNGPAGFTEQSGISFSQVSSSSVAWGDYDNDGDLDIFLCGWTGSEYISKIYKNNADNTFTEQTGITLTGVALSSAAWVDYNNDGALDIFLCGYTGSELVTKLYKNNRNNTFTDQTGISLPDINGGRARWGDYDNDGDQDLLLTGTTGSEIISKIYKNNGDESFTEDTDINLTGVKDSYVSWGDYDNDGDLDILLTGFDNNDSTITKIYKNNSIISNTIPVTPSGLKDTVSFSSVTLTWNKSADNETPADGLTYNAYIYSLPGDTIWSSMADIHTGYRRIPAAGNTQHDTTWTIRNLETGKYYWSVQAVDHGFAGSTFAEEDSFVIYEGFTEQSGIVLPGLNDGCINWADYDNDGDLDILLTGGWHHVSSIYRNNGDNTFTEQTALPVSNIVWSSTAWGDYNNDGYLDILITGIASNDTISRIYKNNGNNTFTEQTEIPLTGVMNGTTAWGDYDNDGDLDIIFTGLSGNGKVTKIYKNNGPDGWGFTEQTEITLAAIDYGSVAWGDYDNDGDLDILLSGRDSNDEKVTKIYENNGPYELGFTEQTGISLTGADEGSTAWGDYDNDGDLDILLSGGIPTGKITKIYRNNGNKTFTEQTGIILPGIIWGKSVWGDYDNDGDLDILITGSDPDWNGIAKIYNNNGNNTFTEQTGTFLTGVAWSSGSWGDYDNDGDLDILLAGVTKDWTEITRIYKNNFPDTNTLPAAPTSLTSTVSCYSVILNWDKATDNETPQDGLTYNAYLYNTDGDTIWSSMANINTGYRKIPAIGNAQHNTTWKIDSLEIGEYCWSVQTIDHAFAGSEFAEEESCTIVYCVPSPTAQNQKSCFGDSVPDLRATGDSLIWYSDIDLTILVDTGNYFSTGKTEPGVYTYYVTQTINGVESDPTEVVLSIFNNPTATITDSTNISCNGFADGTATITPAGGSPPYTYQWDNELSTINSTVTGLHADLYYHVTVYDANLCTAADSVILSEPDPLSMEFDYPEKICPGSNNGYITADVSGGTPSYSYEWSTDETTSTIENLSPGKYEITVLDANECLLVDSVTIDSLKTYQESEICLVTVNNDNRIIVVWEKAYNQGIASYNIYREQSTKDNYVKIGTVPFDSLSIFVDDASLPEENAHFYKISVTDSCGKESGLSPYHKSIHLQTSSGLSNEVNLIWDEYEGFDYYEYKIYRGSSLMDMNSIRTISSSVQAWTDQTPPSGKNYYRIMVVKPDPCFPTKLKSDEYSAPFSNYDQETISGIDHLQEGMLSIYPNPVFRKATIQFPNPTNEDYSLTILDLTGKVLIRIDNITKDRIEMDRRNLPAGVYVLELRGPELYRKKIVFE